MVVEVIIYTGFTLCFGKPEINLYSRYHWLHFDWDDIVRFLWGLAQNTELTPVCSWSMNKIVQFAFEISGFMGWLHAFDFGRKASRYWLFMALGLQSNGLSLSFDIHCSFRKSVPEFFFRAGHRRA
jgi:hypothetical protein